MLKRSERLLRFLVLQSVALLTALGGVAYADPFDALLDNATSATQRWGTKLGLLYLIYGFIHVGWAAREHNPDARAAGWRHVLSAGIVTAGSAAAPQIWSMVKGWIT